MAPYGPVDLRRHSGFAAGMALPSASRRPRSYRDRAGDMATRRRDADLVVAEAKRSACPPFAEPAGDSRTYRSGDRRRGRGMLA